MGKGMAVEVRTTCPAMYQADLQTRKGDRNKLGSFTMAKIGEYNQFGLTFTLSLLTGIRRICFRQKILKLASPILSSTVLVLALSICICLISAAVLLITMRQVLNKLYQIFMMDGRIFALGLGLIQMLFLRFTSWSTANEKEDYSPQEG